MNDDYGHDWLILAWKIGVIIFVIYLLSGIWNAF